MNPRNAFIYGYYVAKIESLATTLGHVDAAHIADIRTKILASAGELWDFLNLEDLLEDP